MASSLPTPASDLTLIVHDISEPFKSLSEKFAKQKQDKKDDAGGTFSASVHLHLTNAQGNTALDCFRYDTNDPWFSNSLHCGVHTISMAEDEFQKHVTSIGEYQLMWLQRLEVVDESVGRALCNVTSIGDHFLEAAYKIQSLDLLPMEKVTSVGDCFLFGCGALFTLKLSDAILSRSIDSGLKNLAISCAPASSKFAKQKQQEQQQQQQQSPKKTAGGDELPTPAPGLELVVYNIECSLSSSNPLLSIEVALRPHLEKLKTSDDSSPLPEVACIHLHLTNTQHLQKFDSFTLYGNVKQAWYEHKFHDLIHTVTMDIPTMSHVNEIGSSFMFKCHNLKTIDLRGLKNVGAIGHHAFFECSSLEAVDLSPMAEVKAINLESLFSACSSLREINMECWTKLEKVRSWTSDSNINAFEKCTALETVKFPTALLSNPIVAQCLPPKYRPPVLRLEVDISKRIGVVLPKMIQEHFGEEKVRTTVNSGFIHVHLTNKEKFEFINCNFREPRSGEDWAKAIHTVTLEADEIRGVVTRVDEGFFSKCYSMQRIDLRGLESVTKISDSFLDSCHDLCEIDLSPLAKVESIGRGFLCGCMGLATIDCSMMTRLSKPLSGYDSRTFCDTRNSWSKASSKLQHLKVPDMALLGGSCDVSGPLKKKSEPLEYWRHFADPTGKLVLRAVVKCEADKRGEQNLFDVEERERNKIHERFLLQISIVEQKGKLEANEAAAREACARELWAAKERERNKIHERFLLQISIVEQKGKLEANEAAAREACARELWAAITTEFETCIRHEAAIERVLFSEKSDRAHKMEAEEVLHRRLIEGAKKKYEKEVEDARRAFKRNVFLAGAAVACVVFGVVIRVVQNNQKIQS